VGKENKEMRVKSPFPVRGNLFTGRVISDKMAKTVVVERQLTHFVPKYERYKKVRSRIVAHVPEGIEVRVNDMVAIGETRKISKTKSFVVIEKLAKEESK